jgi:adenylate cyclase
MESRSVQRRLAAVLAADFAGYTRLMEADSDSTVAAWQDAREDVVKPRNAEFSGRIVKLTGDGFLVEFPTVQDAVNCAIAMQEALATSPLDFRMGVNLGDIIDDGEDIHGEGVNVAARIEALADPGGISISGEAHTMVRNRITAVYEDRGEYDVKNVSTPVRVYAIRLDREREAIVDVSAPVQGFQGRPAIAVLPFDNLSADPDQEFFADGITEDIITRLSKWQWFPVIARNSTFVFKGASVDIKEVDKRPGAR